MTVTISIPFVLGLLHSVVALLCAFGALLALSSAIHDADWRDAGGAALFGIVALFEAGTAAELFGWWS